MALIIKPTGELIEVNPKNGKGFDLTELQNIVEVFFEIVHLDNNLIMCVNEDGLSLNLPKNDIATMICLKQGAISPFGFIVGNALICHNKRVD